MADEASPPDFARDELARDRTALANERTYAAWVRTGLAFIAGALGIARFINGDVPYLLVRGISATLIMLAAASFIMAAWRYMDLCMKMRHLDISLIPHHIVIVISAALVVCCGLALLAVWMMTGATVVTP